MLPSGALSNLGLGGVPIMLSYSAGRQTTIDVTDLVWKRADGRLLSVRPNTDGDRHGMAGHHPADRRRIRQANRRTSLSPLRGRRSPAPSGRGSVDGSSRAEKAGSRRQPVGIARARMFCRFSAAPIPMRLPSGVFQSYSWSVPHQASSSNARSKRSGIVRIFCRSSAGRSRGRHGSRSTR
jgi:hypothetical protein